jgi:hypothetical protein
MPAFLRYGFLLGLAQTAATLLTFALGLHAVGASLQRAQFVENIAGYLLLIVVVALGLRAARARRETDGQASTFGAGARSALALAFVGALIAGLGQALYVAFINPAYSQMLRETILAGAADQLAALSPEDLAIATRNLDLAVSAPALAVKQGVGTFLFAAVVGLAFAAVLRAAVRRDEADKSRAAAGA